MQKADTALPLPLPLPYTATAYTVLFEHPGHSPLKVHEEIRKHKTNPMNITSMIKTFFAHCLVQPILTAKLLPHFILIIDPDIVNPSNTSLSVPRTTE